MPVRRLNHAVLYVHDLASAVDFYTATLGFEVRAEIGGQAAFLRAPGSANDHDLGLFGIGATAIPADAPPRVGLYHLAWEVGTLAELAEIRRALADRGALVGASDHDRPARPGGRPGPLGRPGDRRRGRLGHLTCRPVRRQRAGGWLTASTVPR